MCGQNADAFLFSYLPQSANFLSIQRRIEAVDTLWLELRCKEYFLECLRINKKWLAPSSLIFYGTESFFTQQKVIRTTYLVLIIHRVLLSIIFYLSLDYIAGGRVLFTREKLVIFCRLLRHIFAMPGYLKPARCKSSFVALDHYFEKHIVP